MTADNGSALRNRIRLHEKDYFYSVLDNHRKYSWRDVKTRLLMAYTGLRAVLEGISFTGWAVGIIL
jgi:hypothetical protein